MLVSAGGERVVALEEYFTGYRRSVRRPDELIRSVRVPLPLAGVTAFHKITKRRFDDISSVAVAFALGIRDGVVTRGPHRPGRRRGDAHPGPRDRAGPHRP